MSNEEHLDILKQGVRAWNSWRKANPRVIPNLRKALLRGMNLENANLVKANLIEADIKKSNLQGSNLNGAILNKAILYKANLSRASLLQASLNDADLTFTDFSMADLGEANLSRAKLNNSNLAGANLAGTDISAADMSGAKLSGTDLSFCTVGFTIFSANDLSEAKGLSTLYHIGPSIIGVDTLYQSGGNIPEDFLRSCGVPDNLIAYIPALVLAAEPIQFYSCFISYSHKDEHFAKRLYARLRDEHLRVWFAPENIKGGRKLHEQIFSAIQVHDKLLLVLSEDSMKSEWVITEIRRARTAEREQSYRKLFPIRLVDFETIKQWECFDTESGKDLAIEVREYFIPDFSNWENDSAFEKAFSRLLRDLRAEDIS